MFTPSGRFRASRCAGSVYLPREAREGDKRTRRGSGFHAFAERCREIGYDAALAEVPADADHRSLCEAVDPLQLPVAWEHARQEIAYAYDFETDTARELVGVKNREYHKAVPPLGPTEIAGTVDIIEEGEALAVDDLKSGYFDRAHAMQLATYLLFVARATGRDSGITRAIYVDEATGQAKIVERSYDAFELEVQAAEIRALIKTLAESKAAYEQTGIAETAPGDWCKYCDARPNCPEYSNTGRELMAGARAGETFLARVRRECETPEGAAAWWTFLERVPSITSEIRSAVEKRVPFDLPDGRTVESVTTTKRAVNDVEKLVAALALEGRDVSSALESVQHTTIGKLEKALGGKKAATPIIAALIRTNNGIVEQTSTRIDAVEPKKIAKGAA